MATILVVDDEPDIIELTQLYLSNDGYRVLSAHDGEEALLLVHTQKPDLVVLDLGLPKVDGKDVCRRLRQEGNALPIIVLTARDDDIDKIVLLELGADDYVTKPFNPRVLVSRVRAVLRRSERAPKQIVIRLGDVVLDNSSRDVLLNDQAVPLRMKEFDLLAALMGNPNIALDRERLLEIVWGYDFFGDTRTVDVHIARLREKLRSSSLRIETVWGIGYKLIET